MAQEFVHFPVREEGERREGEEKRRRQEKRRGEEREGEEKGIRKRREEGIKGG